MQQNQVLNLGAILLILLGIVMIVLGAMAGPKIILPPIITGIGFFVIAWVFRSFRSE